MFWFFLRTLVWAILWALGNVVYYDLKRRGVRSFGRFAAFWVGNPTTWITFFVVPDGKQPTFQPPPDDDAGLLAEIRADRALRAGPESVQEGGEGGEVPAED